MKVYRYLSQNELDDFLSGNLTEIGSTYENNDDYKRINNHRYKEGVKHLHFFKNKDDCKRVRFNSEGKFVDFYVAEFDVPITVLALHMGSGRYNASGHFTDIESVREFAVPSSKIKSRYLLSYELDEAHHSVIKEVESLSKMMLNSKDIFKNSTLPELQKRTNKKEESSQKEDASFQPN